MGSNADPPAEGVALAWELHVQRYSYRQIAEHLRAKGYTCGSHETARQWVQRAQAAENYAELLNRNAERWRLAHGLAWDMASLREMVRTGEASPLEVMPHLKWLYRELATLGGTDEPKQTNLTVDSSTAELDPYTKEAVRKAEAAADAEEAALRNGHRP